MRRNRGSSLVEVMVVSAVGTIIATLSIQILSHSQYNAREAQQRLDMQRGLSQWETQLRTDLRAATSVAMPDAQTLVVADSTGQVTYAVKKHLVERTATISDEKTSSEGYAMPGCQVAFTQPEPNQVQVNVEPLSQGKPGRAFTIRQSVGRAR